MAGPSEERREDPLGWARTAAAIIAALGVPFISGIAIVFWSLHVSSVRHADAIAELVKRDIAIVQELSEIKRWRNEHSDFGNRIVGGIEAKRSEVDRRLNELEKKADIQQNHTHENRAYFDLLRGMQGNGK